MLDSITQIERSDDSAFGLAGTRDAWNEGPAMVTATRSRVDAPDQFFGIGQVHLA